MNLNENNPQLIDDNFESIIFENNLNDLYDFQLLKENSNDDNMYNKYQTLETFNESNLKENFTSMIATSNKNLDCPIKYGDRVVLALTPQSANTSNCGFYGCRVANVVNQNLSFDHGGKKPFSFYLRPPINGPKKNGDYIQFGDGVILAQTSQSANTSDCGFYGCRVLTNSKAEPLKELYTYVGEGGCHNNIPFVQQNCRTDPNCEYIGQQSNGCWHKLKQDNNGVSKKTSYPRRFSRVSGNPINYETSSDSSFFKIRVGNSRSNVKTVSLPRNNMIVLPIPINPQNPRWRDRFRTSVNGNKLSVRRLDARYGWGQQLVLKAYDPPKFDQGKIGPIVLYMIPKSNSKNKNGQLIRYNDQVNFSISNNCNGNNCNVLQMESNRLGIINLAKGEYRGFYLRKVIGSPCVNSIQNFNPNGDLRIKRMVIGCDDQVGVYVNNIKIGSYNGWSGHVINSDQLRLNFKEGNIFGFNCYNFGGPGGFIVQIELNNGSLIFADETWDATTDTSEEKFLENMVNHNYNQSWTKTEILSNNSDSPWGFQSAFSPNANFVWLGNKFNVKRVLFKKVIGNVKSNKCFYQLTPNQARCYTEKYPDLKRAFGYNINKLRKHWKTWGCTASENRSYECQNPPSKIGNYNYQGCFNTRNLPKQGLRQSNNIGVDSGSRINNGDSVNRCANEAEKKKHMLFGIQDNGVCVTGNNLDSAKSLGQTPVKCSLLGKKNGSQLYYRDKPFAPPDKELTQKNFEPFENKKNENLQNYYYILFILIFIVLIMLILLRKS